MHQVGFILSNKLFTWNRWRHIPNIAVCPGDPIIVMEEAVDDAEEESKTWKAKEEYLQTT